MTPGLNLVLQAFSIRFNVSRPLPKLTFLGEIPARIATGLEDAPNLRVTELSLSTEKHPSMFRLGDGQHFHAETQEAARRILRIVKPHGTLVIPLNESIRFALRSADEIESGSER